ncbi:MAG: NAD-binding protein [Candidatus Aminicenantes bacterium]|nr:NAD-binding protein [Candidatus Aminicenantes bacterium]
MKESISEDQIMEGQRIPLKSWLKWLGQLFLSYQWWIILISAIVVSFFGLLGFAEYFLLTNPPKYTFLDILYHTLQLFVLNPGALPPPLNCKLEIARFLAPVIAGSTAIRAFIIIFREQNRLLKIRAMRNHIIICGLGNKGLLLALKLKKSGQKVVVIELDEENDNIKECRDRGISVLIGNATSAYYLKQASLNRAKYLFSVCGQDDINAEIAVQARKLIANEKMRPLTCFVHIIEPRFCHFLNKRELGLDRVPNFRLDFLNLFDRAAQAIIDDEQLSPFENKKIGATAFPRLLIVGVGYMGESLIAYIAKRRMSLAERIDEKLIISIIDHQANKKKDLLNLHYPGLDKVCRIDALQMDINSSDFEDGRFLFSADGSCNFDIIYVCLDNSSFALTTALTLDQNLREFMLPIIVRMSRKTGFIELAKNCNSNPNNIPDRIYGFHLLDRALTPELLEIFTYEMVAHNIHDEYVQERLKEGETVRINPYLVSWEKLPERIKDSNRRQAYYIKYKLHGIDCYITPMNDWFAEAVEFTPEEIETMAKIEHKLWMEDRVMDGWKFAPGIKNIRKKTSPCLIPWNELQEKEKEKDRETVRKIPAYLLKAGFQMYRAKKKDTTA